MRSRIRAEGGQIRPTPSAATSDREGDVIRVGGESVTVSTEPSHGSNGAATCSPEGYDDEPPA